jgi:Ca-activated chloride channel family protein
VPARRDDTGYLKVRYKQPGTDESKLITVYAGKADYTTEPDADFRFAAAVAEFALLLKGSDYAGDASFDSLIGRARGAKGFDEDGYRAQFVQLAELARAMMR